MKEKMREGLQPVVLAAGRPFNWKLFWVVFGMSTFGLFMVIPYALSLLPTAPTGSTGLILLQMGINALIYGVLAMAGLFMAGKLGLGLPFIEGWLKKETLGRSFGWIALLAVLIGLVGGGVIILIDSVFFSPHMEKLLSGVNFDPVQSLQPPAWKGLMASFEGGITEEVLLRLFMLTLFVWLGSFISRREDGRPRLGVLWTANILAAILFGVGHLPATAGMGIPITAMVVTRAIVLNGLLGIAFGWLYWRYGLESAMLSHFSADIVLHVIFVLLIPLFS